MRSATRLVMTWRRRLLVTAGIAALAAGAAAGILSFVVAAVLGASTRQALILGLVVGGCLLAVDIARRLNGALSPGRVALWLEERAPALRFALVSSIGHADPPEALTEVIGRAEIDRPAWRRLFQTIARPAIALALAVGATALQRSEAGRALGPALSEAADPRPASALDRIAVIIRPPGYTGRPAERLENPDVLQPLAGSTITVEGALPPSAAGTTVAMVLDSTELAVAVEEGQWRARFEAPKEPAVLRLQHQSEGRLITIEPHEDSLPTVVLIAPARDTVLRVAEGRFDLRANVTDDLGLTSAAFEYIISSGDGERFTFRSGTLGAQRPAGRRSAELSASLDLASLALAPGDVMHLRAVARDANTVTGPGLGASDTRTFRIARSGEYDSVAVEAAAPPEADKTLLSQRMLINLTEALVRRSRTLNRETVVAESRRIGRDQARLRKQVSDLVFSRLGDDVSGEHFHGDGHEHADSQLVQGPLTPEQLLKAAERATEIRNEATDFAHDETPVVAINRPLLEAYNAMWDAGRELDAGAPRAALPPMYAALAAIQKARAAERLYLRGVPPRVVIDLSRVRLQGKEHGSDAVRTSRRPIDTVRRVALERLHVALAAEQGSAAADSLLLIRLSLVGQWPTAAQSFDALIADVRAGRDATSSLLAVRRALDVTTAVRDSVLSWGHIP